MATAGMRVQAIDVIAERLEVLVAGRNLVPGVPDDPFVPAYATESLLLDARNAIGPRGCAMVTTL
ncbi:MAG: hypothetical protein DLM61_19840 [Pseudonocardiales bacterium]|nr:MAG: hypothetical protein DLM61_19840 [Pseudonocardiales bacterium]